MDSRLKQQWAMEETSCLVAIWSSSEVQKKLEGASRTKPVFEDVQREMAAAGYNRTPLQITNKLKKLKMEYREQKRDLGRSGNARTRTGPHFELLDSILGDRPASQISGALNSSTALLEAAEEETLLLQTSTDPDFSFSDVDALAVETLACSSPEPSTSSAQPSTSSAQPSTSSAQPSTSSAAASHQARRVKRKRPQDVDVMQHLVRMEERYMQHDKEQNQVTQQQMQQLNHLMEQNSQQMRDTDREMLAIMSRIAGAVETMAKK